jgi:hypothetical protein
MIPEKEAKRPGKNSIHYDLTAPDSLITPRQYEDRQARLDKFQRRAANPKQKNDIFRRHKDRLRIIDAMLALKASPSEIDGIMAVLAVRPWIEKDREKLKRVIAILNDEAPEAAPQKAKRPEPDPLPELEQDEVDSFIAKLSKKSDPFENLWVEDEGCYCFHMPEGIPHFGITANDAVYAKDKTPEPGDLVIMPACSSGRMWIGHFIAFDGETVKLQTQSQTKRLKADHPPLVVTKIKPFREDDDE